MFSWDAVELSHLPKTMRRLADDIGLEATVKLIRVYRGQKLYVPDRVKESHALYQLLGEEDFSKLVFAHAGCFLVIPSCVKIFKVHRNIQIKADRKLLSISQLAKKYDLTATCIMGILRVS